MTSLARRNGRTAGFAALLVLAMVGLAFASVPLYRLFCQVTGFDGTTMRALAAADLVVPVRHDQIHWSITTALNTANKYRIE